MYKFSALQRREIYVLSKLFDNIYSIQSTMKCEMSIISSKKKKNTNCILSRIFLYEIFLQISQMDNFPYILPYTTNQNNKKQNECCETFTIRMFFFC